MAQGIIMTNGLYKVEFMFLLFVILFISLFYYIESIIPKVDHGTHTEISRTDLQNSHKSENNATKANHINDVLFESESATHKIDVLQILRWPRTKFDNCQPSVMTHQDCTILSEHQKCVFVCDTSYYNTSDVVVMQLFYTKNVPRYRNPKQKWVIWGVEAPPQSHESWLEHHSFPPWVFKSFNIASFPSQKTEVPLSHGVFSIDKSKIKIQDYASNKVNGDDGTKVAWFVSNCKTQSRREDYVAELKKYINIDVYGACGNLTCGKRGSYLHPCALDLLNNKYWFYLSFENSLCQDYATEKLYNMLNPNVNVVPIVLGAANYTHIVPDKTYIDVRDFKTPKDLADYLHFLVRNSTVYNEYLSRKNSLAYSNEPIVPYECRLCKYLHKHKNTKETIPNILDYWSTKTRCITPEQYKPGIFGASLPI